MKKFISSMALCMAALLPTQAQVSSESLDYSLPKTCVKFTFLIEKATFTPGELARYSERYLKEKVNEDAETTYTIVSAAPRVTVEGLPDPELTFRLSLDKKHSVINLSRNAAGVLLAVNTKAKKSTPATPFKPAPKARAINPRDYMTQAMLQAGNSAKMAQLVAQEIYDIRDSRNLLSRGEADFMPKDGEQMKIMLQNLDTQEQALRQLFEGTTVRDTSEVTVRFTPTKEMNRELLFRFSHHLGLVDNDDLAGEPYYITVEDLQIMPELNTMFDDDKKAEKDYIGMYAMRPGRIKLIISHNDQKWTTCELYAAQFGEAVPLSGLLFGKKFTSRLHLDPATGSVVSLETIPLE